MAGWEDIYSKFSSKIPSIASIMGGLKKSTAATYGTAAGQAARGFTGSRTSGAYGGQIGDIFSQRAGVLAGAESNVMQQRIQQIIQMIQMARQAADAEKERSLMGLLGIGQFAGKGAGLALPYLFAPK